MINNIDLRLNILYHGPDVKQLIQCENIMKDIKTLNIRIPRPDWIFIKQKAMEADISMNELIKILIDRYKRKTEGKVDLV